MDQQRGHNYRVLGLVVGLAFLYCGWLYIQQTITGIPRLDGTVGVLLGLFICSRPAANMLDLLFAQQGQAAVSEWSAVAWLALNVLVMLVGWIVITLGATRLID